MVSTVLLDVTERRRRVWRRVVTRGVLAVVLLVLAVVLLVLLVLLLSTLVFGAFLLVPFLVTRLHVAVHERSERLSTK